MSEINNRDSDTSDRSGCSCCNGHHATMPDEMTRRKFVQVTGTGALGAVTLSGLSWALLSRESATREFAPERKPLVVKPILTYDIPTRRTQTSWRSWGGIQTEKAASDEITRITEELSALNSKADFPVSILPVSGVKNNQDINNISDLESADMFIIYAAGGGMDRFDILNKMGKDIIIFCRHKSGPVYLWYEIISPRYLRQHTDVLTVNGINENDIVIDSQDELLWRLRSLCGLKNTISSKILAIGGPGAWSQPLETVMKVVQEKYKLDIQDITYDELGKLIAEARKDDSIIKTAKSRAGEYLNDTGIKLEVDRKYIENCFVLEDVFKRLMNKFNCRAITVNNCMGTIMPMAETTACLTLSLLNDEGFLAFCESDFVVVPSGILMANISGKPAFLNDPTYPHDKIITLAHCTAPRKMDGKKPEPARILTHFESDYGAAPKVEMLVGQVVTNIMPDFSFERNVGLAGKIIDNPMLDICRSQIDISYECDSRKVAEQMPGFHWITVYGDYLREAEYAMKKIGIRLDILT
ncbi:MAG: sugar isomerase [Bacteroidia bacterium]|nr:sugar isomerase [Bacteroidia bacterium]